MMRNEKRKGFPKRRNFFFFSSSRSHKLPNDMMLARSAFVFTITPLYAIVRRCLLTVFELSCARATKKERKKESPSSTILINLIIIIVIIVKDC